MGPNGPSGRDRRQPVPRREETQEAVYAKRFPPVYGSETVRAQRDENQDQRRVSEGAVREEWPVISGQWPEKTARCLTTDHRPLTTGHYNVNRRSNSSGRRLRRGLS